MKRVPLTKGLVALVDDADFHLVRDRKWHAQLGQRTYYAYSGRWPNRVAMHRLILGLSGSTPQVDHVNRDGLDNRRRNLRPATRSENAKNRPRPIIRARRCALCLHTFTPSSNRQLYCCKTHQFRAARLRRSCV